MNRNSYTYILNPSGILVTGFLLLSGLLTGSYAQTTPPDCKTGCIEITVTRLIGYVKPADPTPAPANIPEPAPPVIPPPSPNPTPTVLATPVFNQQNSAVAFGATVSLTIANTPDGAGIEYSTDNGTTWVTRSQFFIDRKMDVLGRFRMGDRVSMSSTISFMPYFQRMLVTGNSIMSHGPAPELGWFNNNGMAASAPEKDFLHILTARLRTLYPAFDTRLQSSGNLERYYGMSSYSLDEFNEPVQQFRPDLILVRMGENVEDGQVAGRNFEGNFRQFLERLASLSGSQPVKIVVTTSVWSNPNADAVIRKVAGEKGYTLVDLSCMVGQGQYFASQYANPGVAAHPNDAGMQRIADMIWDKIQ